MKKETWSKEDLKAIENSINYWTNITHFNEEEKPNKCPLCNLYKENERGSIHKCLYCPIYYYTKGFHCNKTPYLDWNRYQNMNYGNRCRKVRDQKSYELATAMRNFLEEIRQKMYTDNSHSTHIEKSNSVMKATKYTMTIETQTLSMACIKSLLLSVIEHINKGNNLGRIIEDDGDTVEWSTASKPVEI